MMTMSARSEREPVAGFLISPVAAIFGVHFHMDAIQCAGDFDSLIMTGVVDHDDKIDDPLRHHLLVGAAQGASSIIRRHHHDIFWPLSTAHLTFSFQEANIRPRKPKLSNMESPLQQLPRGH